MALDRAVIIASAVKHGISNDSPSDLYASAIYAFADEMIAIGVADERERAAKVCEDLDMFNYDDPGESYSNAIRKGGE